MSVTAAVIGGVAAATSAGVGILNYEAAQSAAAASKSLANQQADELKNQQEAQATLAAQEAASGSSFGFSGGDAVASGLGFGNAPASSPNSGRAQITGLG